MTFRSLGVCLFASALFVRLVISCFTPNQFSLSFTLPTKLSILAAKMLFNVFLLTLLACSSFEQEYYCLSSQKECGTGCIPLSYTCCSDGLGGCPPSQYCVSNGCCPRGKICSGGGGLSIDYSTSTTTYDYETTSTSTSTYDFTSYSYSYSYSYYSSATTITIGDGIPTTTYSFTYYSGTTDYLSTSYLPGHTETATTSSFTSTSTTTEAQALPPTTSTDDGTPTDAPTSTTSTTSTTPTTPTTPTTSTAAAEFSGAAAQHRPPIGKVGAGAGAALGLGVLAFLAI